MQFTVAAAVALAGFAAASPAPAPKPFELVVSSTDKSIDGKKISGCHAGALVEAACLSDKSETFYTESTGGSAPIPDSSVPAPVYYNLQLDGSAPKLSLILNGDYASNVQEALFEEAENGVGITFSAETEQAGIISYLDDSVTPPNGTEPTVYNNWYVCETYFQSYTYQTLAWVTSNGSAKPQNPSCIYVTLHRKFL